MLSSLAGGVTVTEADRREEAGTEGRFAGAGVLADSIYRGHGPLRPWGALYCGCLENGIYRGPLPTAAGVSEGYGERSVPVVWYHTG